MIDGKALSRSFKAIPNDYIRQTLETTINSYEFDGEIMIPDMNFNDLSGTVRRKEGRPTNFEYHVFDYISYLQITGPRALELPYIQRMRNLAALQNLPPFVKKVLPFTCANEIELAVYQRDGIAAGYEGSMIRSQHSPYKCGRSSFNEGYLLKIKAFEDAEATIYGVEEMMHNDNVALKDAFGRTERSTHQSGMRPAGVMGKLLVRWHGKEHIEFEIGTGFTAEMRDRFWKKRGALIGKLVKFKHQPTVGAEKPRFPVFLGFRDDWDL